MLPETVVSRMFQDKKPSWLQAGRGKDQGRDCFQPVKIVGRVGKYKIIFISASGKESSYIKAENFDTVQIH